MAEQVTLRDRSAPDPDECDLVMKGGITSGVVYPAAVLALKDAGYKFRSIGGASAGAIAAAATAAAEFGGGHGTARLKKLSEELVQPGLMTKLFQPTREARPLFRLLLRLQETKHPVMKVLWVLSTLLRRFWIPTLVWVLAVLGALSFMISRFGGGNGGTWTGKLVLILILVVIAVMSLSTSAAMRVWRLVTTHLPTSYFGMCTGMRTRPSDEPALTEWLHQRIQGCANLPLEKPLTFGNLKSSPKKIDLQMMTTDLTYALPLQLPQSEQEFTDASYYFSVEEFEKLFPKEVIDHLRELEIKVPETAQNPELRRFPSDDLPIVVATRMSLSFPVLLSAVPLWTLKQEVPVKHWISDGGITSNFPIHFFDSWLPTRPTFGLNLVPTEQTLDPASEAQAADFEKEPYKRRKPRRRAVIGANTFSFLSQILDTMQNWRDTVQSELPGFRDRIKDIALDKAEGGMNLTMPPEVIERLIKKGEDAGMWFQNEFVWCRHQFERFQILVDLLDRHVLRDPDEGPVKGMKGAYENGFARKLAAADHCFTQGDPATKEWCEKAAKTMDSFFRQTNEWDDKLKCPRTPTPTPVMRVTPRA